MHDDLDQPHGGTAPRPLTTDPRRTRRGGAVVPHALALAAILLITLNLRPGATTLGPVLQEVSASLGLTGGTAGLLAALPGLCFGAVGFIAVRVAARMGLSAAVLGGAALVVIGLTARALVGGTGPFLAFTLLTLAGMALGNVLVPAWIKLHSGGHGVLYMTVYSVVLTAGGSLGALVTAPWRRPAGPRAGGGRSARGPWSRSPPWRRGCWWCGAPVATSRRWTTAAAAGPRCCARRPRSPSPCCSACSP